jgi:hypothetical protein
MSRYGQPPRGYRDIGSPGTRYHVIRGHVTQGTVEMEFSGTHSSLVFSLLASHNTMTFA